MSMASAQFDPSEVGYRRLILAVGVISVGVHALLPYFDVPLGTFDATVFGSTVLLGALYALDSHHLRRHDAAVRHAWAYAMLAPASLAAWYLVGPVLSALVPSPTVVDPTDLFVGAPTSVLAYTLQRGRRTAAA
jgi:hypothetical protein